MLTNFTYKHYVLRYLLIMYLEVSTQFFFFFYVLCYLGKKKKRLQHKILFAKSKKAPSVFLLCVT